MKSRKRKDDVERLPVIRPRVAGVDIGSREHWVACPPDEDGRPNVRVFPSVTRSLEELADWLKAEGVDSVAMESTGVYWIPLYELLESRGFEVLLVNARHVRNVPGRKSDMSDCQWLQLLHSVGLLRGSFRPPENICKIRALQRQMGNLVAERNKAIQWMQKSLDQMNVQVHKAVTDLTGKTGMAIIRAIVGGERNPEILARHRDSRCRKSEADIAEYLHGTWRDEHLFNLKESLTFYDVLQAGIDRYESQILAELSALAPEERADAGAPAHPKTSKVRAMKRKASGRDVRTALWRATGVDLTTIDGIGIQAARTTVTEIGLDLSRFPDEHHFVSWLRLAPRLHRSAGKVLPRKRRAGMGATRLAQAFRMAAVSLKHSKSALGARYRRLARTKNSAIAVFDLARRLATLVFRMLRYGSEYVDRGQRAEDERYHDRRVQGLRRAARDLGFQLTENSEEAGAVSG